MGTLVSEEQDLVIFKKNKSTFITPSFTDPVHRNAIKTDSYFTVVQFRWNENLVFDRLFPNMPSVLWGSFNQQKKTKVINSYMYILHFMSFHIFSLCYVRTFSSYYMQIYFYGWGMSKLLLRVYWVTNTLRPTTIFQKRKERGLCPSSGIL